MVSERGFEPRTPRPERGMFPLHYSEMVREGDFETPPRVPKTRMLPLHYSLMVGTRRVELRSTAFQTVAE